MQNTMLSTVEYKKISQSWQEAYNSHLTSYTRNKAEGGIRMVQ